MSSGKTSKYLKYAIGEIILVVIGILIALQLNMWREQRANARVENNYLKGILNDLNQDIYNLKEIIDKDTTQFNSYTLLLKSFTDKEINKYSPDFISAIGESYYTYGFKGSSIVFEDMKSSGKINFIKSDVLRFSILEYYNESEILLANQNQFRAPLLAELKNEAFMDKVDMNSLVEGFLMPPEWKGQVDNLDLSFFDSDIKSEEVKAFANRISVVKGYLSSSYRANLMLLVKAERLKEKLTEYLAEDEVQGEGYLPVEYLDAIKSGDKGQLESTIPNTALGTCFETEFDNATLMVVCIFENNLESLKYFVEAGGDIEQVCENKTPLMYAAKFGRLKLLKYLLEQGAELNKVSSKGKTALTYAIQYDHPEVEFHLKNLGAE